MIKLVSLKGVKDADTCNQEWMNKGNTVNNAERELRNILERQKMDRGRSKLRKTENLPINRRIHKLSPMIIHQVHPKQVKPMRIRET